MKETLSSKYKDIVNQQCNPANQHNRNLWNIHSFYVNLVDNSMDHNLLLGAKPPTSIFLNNLFPDRPEVSCLNFDPATVSVSTTTNPESTQQ